MPEANTSTVNARQSTLTRAAATSAKRRGRDVVEFVDATVGSREAAHRMHRLGFPDALLLSLDHRNALTGEDQRTLRLVPSRRVQWSHRYAFDRTRVLRDIGRLALNRDAACIVLAECVEYQPERADLDAYVRAADAVSTFLARMDVALLDVVLVQSSGKTWSPSWSLVAAGWKPSHDQRGNA